MLTPDIVETVSNYVKEKPRTIQEIAKLLDMNWRTADKYVQWIESHQGLISTRTFRGGTRGALKIVYYRLGEGGEPVRKRQLDLIMSGRMKDDFDFLDLYELVPAAKRKVYVDSSEYPNVSKKQGFLDYLSGTKTNLFVFSGNLSWINLVEGKRKMEDVVSGLLKKDVPIKVLARIDLTSTSNIKHLVSLDKGRGLVQVRHHTQPLRGFVRDQESMRFKSVFTKQDVRGREIEKPYSVFYKVDDKEWVDWTTGIFWNMFSTAVPWEKRLEAIGEVEKLL